MNETTKRVLIGISVTLFICACFVLLVYTINSNRLRISIDTINSLRTELSDLRNTTDELDATVTELRTALENSDRLLQLAEERLFITTGELRQLKTAYNELGESLVKYQGTLGDSINIVRQLRERLLTITNENN